MENNELNVAVNTKEETQEVNCPVTVGKDELVDNVSSLFRNEMTVQGTVISVQTNAKFSKVQIITDAATSKAIPEIIFYRTLPRSITPKTRVRITGYSYTRINKEDEKNIMFDTIFVGDSIEKAPRALSDFLDPEHLKEREGGFGPDINQIFCLGSCDNIISLGNGVRLLVLETIFVKQKRFIEFFCFRRQADYLSYLTKGDLVAVYGNISTNQDKVGMRNAKQDIVCRDIVKYE